MSKGQTENPRRGRVKERGKERERERERERDRERETERERSRARLKWGSCSPQAGLELTRCGTRTYEL